MTRIAISSNEPVVAIVVPTRLLPQLVAFLAAAANAGSGEPCVETTAAEPTPSRPGLAKTLPPAPLRLVGGAK